MSRDSSGHTGRLIVTGITMPVTVGLFLVRPIDPHIVSDTTYTERAAEHRAQRLIHPGSAGPLSGSPLSWATAPKD